MISNTFCQIKQVKKGEYLKIPENKKFEGVYQSIIKKDTIKIILWSKKMSYDVGGGIFADNIVGDYYINGKKMTNINHKEASQYAILNGMASDKNNPNILNAGFMDKKYMIYAGLTITMTDINHLHWKLIPTEIVSVNGKIPNRNYSLPMKMILKRIK